jgi:hypothetical protein
VRLHVQSSGDMTFQNDSPRQEYIMETSDSLTISRRDLLIVGAASGAAAAAPSYAGAGAASA